MSEEPVRLKYHQATFDMLGETPAVSAAALDKIIAWERRHRTKLPGSLREWYALERAERKWTAESLDHSWFIPAPLELVLQDLARLRRARKGRGTLRLPIHGPEDELRYYAHLDGAEDPAVFAKDSDSSDPEGTFSEFLFHQLWEGLPEFRPTVATFSLTATEPAFSGMELDFLTDHFQEGPREVAFRGDLVRINPFTGEPMKLYPFRFYFFHPAGRVRVCCQADPARGETEASWGIDAPSKKALAETVQRVWPCGTLSQTLSGTTRQAKAVLKEVRSSP